MDTTRQCRAAPLTSLTASWTCRPPGTAAAVPEGRLGPARSSPSTVRNRALHPTCLACLYRMGGRCCGLFRPVNSVNDEGFPLEHPNRSRPQSAHSPATSHRLPPPDWARFHCGRIVRGLVMFLSSLLFAPGDRGGRPLATSDHCSGRPDPRVAGSAWASMSLRSWTPSVIARRGRDLFQVMDYNHPLVYALFILVGLTYPAYALYFIRSSVFEAFAIPSASEVPTLLPGDRFLVNKTT